MVQNPEMQVIHFYALCGVVMSLHAALERTKFQLFEKATNVAGEHANAQLRFITRWARKRSAPRRLMRPTQLRYTSEMTDRCLNARDPITGCRPLGVEVWKIDKAVLVDWMPAQSLPYKGLHGMKLTIPVWENK
jgi:hypothetical protein